MTLMPRAFSFTHKSNTDLSEGVPPYVGEPSPNCSTCCAVARVKPATAQSTGVKVVVLAGFSTFGMMVQVPASVDVANQLTTRATHSRFGKVLSNWSTATLTLAVASKLCILSGTCGPLATTCAPAISVFCL